jgi:KUP system potassium uptake protein
MNQSANRKALFPLALGALGVVYGDIGTSPLYTLKEVFSPQIGIPLDEAHLVGATSVIFWALMFVVTLKYVVLILRADNRGEGGIMALTALAAHAAGSTPRRRVILLLLGVFGASLFYGDSVITPAISVLSALEGMEIVTPALKRFVVPISIGVLLALFLIQRRGTASVGKLFGPIMLLWFGALAVAGGAQILRRPEILAAFNPLHAYTFLAERGWHLFAAVGAIVLALTGAEALYADMGHFGRKPIQLAWMGFVLPSLMLNYFGQGALLIREPSALENPFFRMFPPAMLMPAVLVATIATVIASQAVISGAFSMTQQAIQLGFLPRMQILFTSAKEAGQIYVPRVNWALLVAVVLAVIGFQSSSALAAAYGIAVTATMLITTILTFFIVRYAWKLPLALALASTAVFLVFDSILVASCSLKFLDGGWFPLALGFVIFTIMATWKRGRELLVEQISADDPELVPFVTALTEDPTLQRAPRIAIYPVANVDRVPQAMLHNLKHNCVLHEQNVILTVTFHDVPWVPPEDRIEVTQVARDFWQVRISYGFMNSPDVPEALTLCKDQGLDIEPMRTSYFVSRETVIPTKGAGMAHWRERLFATMSRNSGSAVEFFKLPNNGVIELGTRVQI